MKKRIIVITVIAVLLLGIVGVCVGFAWKDYNRFEVKKEEVTVELGQIISRNSRDYIEASEKALEETELDTSDLDIMKAGTYKIHATWKNHSADITVIVKDTVAPEVTLKNSSDLSIMVGQELKATDLIEKVDDLAGIKSVSFNRNQIEVASDSDNLLEKIGLKFDAAGEQKITFIAEDSNGNKTEKEITVKVVEDYLSHVTGFHDITTEQGSKPDWMEGIVADDKIAGIAVDESAVDINTPGEYQLKYVISGNDGETTVEQAIKVTVTEKVVVQEVSEKDDKPNKNSSQNSNRTNSTRPSENRGSEESTSTGGGSSDDNSSSIEDIPVGGEIPITETGNGTTDSGINYVDFVW